MNNAYASYSFPYFLESMSRLGLYKIDLWGGVQHFDPYEADVALIRQFKKTLKERGLEIVSYTPEILGYPYNFASRYKEVREASVEYAKKNIRIAAELGAPVMLISPGWGMWDDPYEESVRYSLDSMLQAAGEAARAGIRLALEHLTPQSSNLLTSVERVADMAEAVDKPEFGVALDLGQMSVFGETIDQYFDRLDAKIQIVHMMDGAPGGHLAFGDGILPLESLYKRLTERGYQGTITLEINDGRYGKTPHEALAQCLKAMEAWEGRG